MWHDVKSECLTIGNGSKQRGVLTPYLFTGYVRNFLIAVSVLDAILEALYNQ